jgi:hypothetical protein
MRMTRTKAAGVAAIAATALGAAVAAGPSQAGYGGKEGITIKAVLGAKGPAYKGPSKVSRGATITFVNASDPKEIGPHTFSLVEPDLIPEDGGTRKGANKCFKAGLCGAIAIAHKFDPKTEKINKPSVDKGKKGAWDVAFGEAGDSFYTEEEGGTETRKVVDPVGARLTFFCAVHPNMVKRIKVVE